MSRILVLDNYDSFTWNLVHYLEGLTADEIVVCRNDEITLSEIKNFDLIVLSPGPGLPSEAGILIPLIREYAQHKPILGVCLGLQAIAEAFGGKLKQLKTVHHGLQRKCFVNDPGEKLFENISSPFMAGRYHSWVIDESILPADFSILSRDEEENIMAIKHNHFPLHAVQFHPESIMTPDGKQLLQNWLGLYA